MVKHKLADALRVLHEQYGDVELPEPRTPFELIVWENAGYLVDDERRASAFDALKRKIGSQPAQILAARPERLADAIREGGMQPQQRAEKLRRCAELAIQFAGGDLASTLKSMPVQKRRALLKRFPGIADPGADKILLLCGYDARPALESNGLRVMQRLGFVEEDPSYARMYNAATAVLSQGGVDFVEAFTVLREHGRELCKRNAPVCPVCPLREVCPYAFSTSKCSTRSGKSSKKRSSLG